jgi:mannose/cellobiose epimerase-like protein (N-acyl-D-glucosamine 2-epimerase family)
MTAARSGAADLAGKLETWLFEKTLPWWAAHGADPDAGGFHERLDAKCEPVTEGGKRAMVQARQTAVFAQAFLLNRLPAGKALAHAGRDFLCAHCRHPDGGWRFRVGRDGAPMDDTRDLYAQAFVLYALAWLHRLDSDGDGTPRTQADATMAFLDRHMAHPKGGFHEALDDGGRPVDGPRRQNPHMHLFEALLEWYAATKDTTWRDRAAALAALFTDRFRVDGTLREYFDDALAPLPGDRGRIVEPGHHYEWTWLLHRYRALGGDDLTNMAAGLYEFAERHGVDAASGGIIDTVAPDGTATQPRRRLWPQTEALKAHAARFEATGDPAFADRLDRQIDALMRAHVDGAAEGAWREHLDADGALLVPDLPASSLYHVTLAAAEVARCRRL